jgi:hypothetical protein
MWTEYYYNTSTLSGYIGSGDGLLSGANASDFIVRSQADFVVATGNNRRLTIASSTGAATFSSSVTATQFAAGSASPTYPFNSISAAGTQALLNSTRTGGGGIILQNNSADSVYLGTANWAGVSGFGTSATDICLAAASNSSAIVFATGTSVTERMRISSLGALTYNTSDAQGWFAGFSVSGTNFAYMGSTGQFANSGGTSTDFGIRSANAMAFYTSGGNERMRITSGGFTKASNTNSYLSASGGYHEVRSNLSDNTLVLSNTNASGSAYYSEIVPNNTTQTHFLGYSGGAFRIYIYSNGDVRNTNNVFGAISDIKLKENIIDATPKLNDLLKVKIRNYNLIGEETKQIGVIAQELEEIFPSMIDESEDFEKVEVTDEDGNITTEKKSLGTKTKSVKYSVFVPMLIKAIQEQQAQIEELKQIVATK